MKKDLRLGEKIKVSGRDATVLCCSGDEVLIHTSRKFVHWIHMDQIDSFHKAAV